MEDFYRSQFRLPHALYEQLRASAQQEGRSINAEVVARLQHSFASNQQDQPVTAGLVKDMLAEMRATMNDDLARAERELRQYVEDALKKFESDALKRSFTSSRRK